MEAATAVMNWFAPSSVTDTAQAAVWMILPALFVANVDPAQLLTTKICFRPVYRQQQRFNR